MDHARSLLLLSCALFLLVGCGDSGGDSPATDTSSGLDVVVTADGATAADAEAPDVGAIAPLHAITSATPLVARAALTEGHAGWGQGHCLGCHEAEHGSLTSAGCVTCHGPNGAPQRDGGHPGATDCARCHAGEHPGADFGDDPLTCAGCHGWATADGVCGATSDEYDVVVVGAGGGGLSAAATLALAGQRVLVIERHNKVGGCMTNFWRGDYRFEVSLHGIGNLDGPDAKASAMLRRLGVADQLTIVHADRYMYRAQFPDWAFYVPTDAAEYEAALIERFPEEEQGISEFFQLFVDIEEMFAALMAQLEGDSSLLDAIAAEKPEAVGRIIGYMNATLAEVMDDYFVDPELKTLFSLIASYAGAEPERLSAALFAGMWVGYHFSSFSNFVGGSQTVSDALADVVRANGGAVLLNTTVTALRVEGERVVEVQTDRGQCFTPSWVVSNANTHTTLDLIGREDAPADWAAEIDEQEPAFGLVAVYLGVSHDFAADFGEAHEIYIHKQSGDMGAPYAAGRECRPQDIAIIATNYSMFDPTAAPDGHNVISLTGMLDPSCQNEWEWGDHEAYRTYKEQVGQELVRRVEEYVPGLGRYVEVMEVGGPQTIAGFTANPGGSIYGSDPIPEWSLLNRVKQETPFENLFLAGAWTFPGPGQETVMTSGENAANFILDKLAEETAR